ncbi:AAA family ATPase [Candidatus Uhrbacteria bacterium]|nr:AAA family ATPase [Candidatus Uhrbacteria bacterium]
MTERIIGHAAALKMLDQAATHPAPGYLLHGPDGIGKRLVADRFAARLLSVDESALMAHPDFVRVKREDGEQGIAVESVRDLLTRMHLTSAVGGRKVALIEDADALNEAGTNSFLKAVEEPDEHAAYIFITEQPERMPATLRSRLVNVALMTVPAKDIRAWLGNEYEPSLVERAVRASRGCPGIAKRLLEDPEAWQKNEDLARSLLTVLRDGPEGRALGELERLAKTMSASADPAKAWRGLISACERLLPECAADRPETFAAIGRGLVLARRFTGGSLSPHLGLEWSVVEPYYDGDIPSFLHPSYL